MRISDWSSDVCSSDLWSGPVARIDMDRGWHRELAASYIDVDYAGWRVAVIVSRDSSAAQIGFSDGSTGTLPADAAQLPYRRTGRPAFPAMKPRHLIVVARNGSSRAPYGRTAGREQGLTD